MSGNARAMHCARRLCSRLGFLTSLLSVFTALDSCVTSAVRQPESRIGRTASRASLITYVREPTGKPVEFCDVVIEQAHLGGKTGSEGIARIAGIPPGTWVVSWRVPGGFGDSMGVKFVAGRVETLNAIVRFERVETWRPR
jgi:hypothetical protein